MFNKLALRIPSNFNSVIQNIEKIDIPGYMLSKFPVIKSLRKEVEVYNKSKVNQTGKRKSVIEDLDESLRYNLSKYFQEEVKGNINEKLDMIKNDKKFQWIGELYPAVFTSERQVLFTSVSKLLVKIHQ